MSNASCIKTSLRKPGFSFVTSMHMHKREEKYEIRSGVPHSMLARNPGRCSQMFTGLIGTQTLMCNFLFSGPGNGTEETREESKVEGECEFVDSSESECDEDFECESASSWESESNANDSVYIPTPIREEKT